MRELDPAGARRPAGLGNDLERMARLVRSNERLFRELGTLRRQLDGVGDYLAEPGCNEALGRARLEHLRRKYHATLALLRANRLEARGLLARYA